MSISDLPTRPAPLSPVRRLAHPHHVLLDAVGHALGEAVRAVLDDDREAARRVLRDGARRHSLLLAAEDRSRQLVVGSQHRRRAVEDLVLLADVARISGLVDDLARLVLTGAAGPTDSTVSRTHLEAMLMLARYGEERLHQLADGLRAPELDREFVRCGRCLLEAADCLGTVTAVDHDGRRPSLECCVSLVTAVLQASRHALRAAAV